MGAALREAFLKQKFSIRYDTKVIRCEFKVSSLVLKRNYKESCEGKLVANWEGPYRIMKMKNRAHYLENLQGEKLARPWNTEKLRQYYS